MSSVWRKREQTEGFRLPTRLALLAMVAAVGTVAISCAPTDARAPVSRQPTVDPEVRAVTRRGTARVLVELSIPNTDEVKRPEVIGRAQDALLQRLHGTSTRLFRRYTTVPLVALQIDAEALARLEAMPDLVTKVRLDTTVRPSSHLADEGSPG
jgi:hypothetical protein